MITVTLWEPWATLLVTGKKTIETRSFPIKHRGWLAIHSALNYPRMNSDLCLTEPFRSALSGYDPASTLGHVLGVVRVVECVQMGTLGHEYPEEPERSFGLYEPGRFEWRTDVQLLLPKPIKARGFQGFWNFQDPALARLIYEFEI